MNDITETTPPATKTPGVYFEAHRNRYRARIRVGGPMRHLGRFRTLEEAIAAVKVARSLVALLGPPRPLQLELPLGIKGLPPRA